MPSNQPAKPNANQKCIFNVIFKNGLQLGDFTTMSQDEILAAFKNAKAEGKLFQIPTGDRTESHYDNIMLVPTDEVILFGAAQISKVDLLDKGIIRGVVS